jgi:hypothetical protein
LTIDKIGLKSTVRGNLIGERFDPELVRRNGTGK